MFFFFVSLIRGGGVEVGVSFLYIYYVFFSFFLTQILIPGKPLANWAELFYSIVDYEYLSLFRLLRQARRERNPREEKFPRISRAIFFLAGFFRVSLDGLNERGTGTRSP